jgi:hypothetical protein
MLSPSATALCQDPLVICIGLQREMYLNNNEDHDNDDASCWNPNQLVSTEFLQQQQQPQEESPQTDDAVFDAPRTGGLDGNDLKHHSNTSIHSEVC